MKGVVNKYKVHYSFLYATFPESLLLFLISGSITTSSLVEIMIFSLLIEADRELVVFQVK